MSAPSSSRSCVRAARNEMHGHVLRGRDHEARRHDRPTRCRSVAKGVRFRRVTASVLKASRPGGTRIGEHDAAVGTRSAATACPGATASGAMSGTARAASTVRAQWSPLWAAAECLLWSSWSVCSPRSWWHGAHVPPAMHRQGDAIDSAHLGYRHAAHLGSAGSEHGHRCLEDQRADGGPQGEMRRPGAAGHDADCACAGLARAHRATLESG